MKLNVPISGAFRCMCIYTLWKGGRDPYAGRSAKTVLYKYVYIYMSGGRDPYAGRSAKTVLQYIYMQLYQ